MEDRSYTSVVPPSAPPVRDHRQLPPGVLPRHLQQWVLIGIAIVMIGILAVSGGPTTPRPTTTTPSPGAAAVDANQTRIEEYQRRIQEQAERLAHEQTALTRAKQAVVDTTSLGGGSPVRGGDRSAGASTSTSTMSTAASGASLQQERAQRDYRSLFADNVAFSRDHAPRGNDPTASPAPAASPPLAPAPPLTAIGLTSPTGRTERGQPTAVGPAPDVTAVPDVTATPHPDRPPTRVATRSGATSASELTYRLTEGTIVETVLTNRLDGTFAGPVNCLVTTAVYALDHEHLLIPAGSRVLGEAKPVNTFGQSRLAVVFHRLMLPNGTHVDLHDFHGLNQVGEIGLRDQVDRHYAHIFGASLAVGAIAGLAQAQTTVGLDATSFDVYRQGAATNLAQSSARILDRFLNILPTVTILEGHRIKVYLSNDLELPAYRDTRVTVGGRP